MVQNLAVRVKNLNQDDINDGFKNLQVEDIGLKEPEADQVVVKVTLRPVNPTDLVTAAGFYPGLKDQVPYTVGSEGVGVIEKLGDKVTGFSKGQRVVWVGSIDLGTWVQFITVPASKLKLVPDAVKDTSAAQFFVNPNTVLGLVDVAAVPQDHYLLQAAAASTLGKMLIQYTSKLNIKTINIVRRAEQVQALKDLGADEVINSSEEDVVARVKEITDGKGAYAALDPIGGNMTANLLDSIRPGGTVHLYGALAGGQITLPVMALLPTCKNLSGFILPVWLGNQPDDRARGAIFDKAMGLLEDGTFTPQAGEIFPLDKVHDALAAHSKSGRDAKVFLK